MSRDLVRDSRNLRLLERQAECLAPEAAVERLLERMDRARTEPAAPGSRGHPAAEHAPQARHPDALDELANRHPELALIAAHAGSPWLVETIAIAVRHANPLVRLPLKLPRVTAEMRDKLLGGSAERLLGLVPAPAARSATPRVG